MYFCGIDVAKRKHVVLVLDEQGQIVKPPFTVHNTRAGFEQLHRVLSGLSGSVSIGLEATGHYWLTLFEDLSEQYPATVLNPMQIHAYCRSGVRKCKTDRADAFWIADFVRIGNRPPTNQRTPLLLQLRELTRFRSRLTEQIGDCKVRP